VLHVAEHGFAIGCDGNASDFAILGSNQETADRIGRGFGTCNGGRAAHCGGFAAVTHFAGNCSQHHAVGHIGVSAVIGLDPQHATGVEVQAIWAGEVIDCGQARQVDVGCRFFFCSKEVNVPSKFGGSDTAGLFFPANDVTMRIALVGLGSAIVIV